MLFSFNVLFSVNCHAYWCLNPINLCFSTWNREMFCALGKTSYTFNLLMMKQPWGSPHDELTGISPLICRTQSGGTTPQSVKLEFIIRGLWEIQGSDQISLSCHRTMKDKSHMFSQLCGKKINMCLKGHYMILEMKFKLRLLLFTLLLRW